MKNAPGLDIAVNLNPLLIILAAIVIVLYSYIAYKYTVPIISKSVKVFLIILRSFVLILIFLLIFEPSLISSSEEKKEPVNYIFADNSSSIIHNDSISASRTIKDAISELRGELKDRSELFLFGKKALKVEEDFQNKLVFNENFTNLQSIVSKVDSSDENIANVIIITDGIFNTGEIPIDRIESIGIPFNVLAVGDTARKRDIIVKDISMNNYLYSGKETVLEAVILSDGFENETVAVDLTENGKVLSTRNILIDQSGINRERFNYLPTKSGEVKLSIKVAQLKDEESYANNVKTVYKNILNSKLKIGLITDSPSPDYTFIKNSVEADDNYEIVPIINVGAGKTNYSEVAIDIDSLDILGLIGYPSNNTSAELFRDIKKTILELNKPYFVNITPKTDLNKLNELESKLPFEIQASTIEFTKSQLAVNDNLNSLLQINSKYSPDIWLSLPPIPAVSAGIGTKIESNIVAVSKIKNIPTSTPFMVTRSAGKSRSIAILATELWRWKLQNNSQDVFNQLIGNIIQWLKVNSDLAKFKVSTSQKIYSAGEDIEFSAELFDDKLAPVTDAEIKVMLKSNGNESELFLSLNETGIYSGSTTPQLEGDITYTAQAILNSTVVAETSGKISIEKTNLESLNFRMNTDLLNTISTVSGGTLIYPDQLDELTNEINSKNAGKTRVNFSRSEYKLWSSEISLIILIVLFSIEWFVRKRTGMI